MTQSPQQDPFDDADLAATDLARDLRYYGFEGNQGFDVEFARRLRARFAPENVMVTAENVALRGRLTQEIVSHEQTQALARELDERIKMLEAQLAIASTGLHTIAERNRTKEKTFRREPRYVVFKIKDIHAYLMSDDMHRLQVIGEIIAAGRLSDAKPTFNAVVVEQDWPEFEVVWEMIEARMADEPAGDWHD